jgi:hypothetical protein
MRLIEVDLTCDLIDGNWRDGRSEAAKAQPPVVRATRGDDAWAMRNKASLSRINTSESESVFVQIRFSGLTKVKEATES